MKAESITLSNGNTNERRYNTYDNYNIKTVDKGTDMVVRFFFLHSTGSGKILILSKMWKVCIYKFLVGPLKECTKKYSKKTQSIL